MKTLITASILALCATGANATITANIATITSVTDTANHCVIDTVNYDLTTGAITGDIYIGDNWNNMYFTTYDKFHKNLGTNFSVKTVYIENSIGIEFGSRTDRSVAVEAHHVYNGKSNGTIVDHQSTGTPWTYFINATLDKDTVYGFYVTGDGGMKKWCGEVIAPPPECSIDQATKLTLPGQMIDVHNFALKKTIPLKLNITGYDNSTVSATGQTLSPYDTLDVSAWLTGNEVRVNNGDNPVEINMNANSHKSARNLLNQIVDNQKTEIMQAILTLECK